MKLKKVLQRTPFLGQLSRKIYWLIVRRQPPPQFPGVQQYWETRYRKGGTSGAGSYSQLAAFKAAVLNDFVAEHNIGTVIEYGCGDGNQLRLASYPEYLGFDVSSTAVEQCRDLFAGDATKRFAHLDDHRDETAELTLSLDVIYHLVEDNTYYRHMELLFSSSTRFVAIYSSNHDGGQGTDGMHVRHRCFTDWIEINRPDWTLLEHIPNKFPPSDDHSTSSFADFYLYKKR